MQKYFAALYFIWRSIYQSTTILSRQLDNIWHRYPKGIDNPFNTSGCEYLLFVCRCCLRCVAWFSYWFDNLGLITEGNTYRRYTTSSLPLWGNTDVVLADISAPDRLQMKQTLWPQQDPPIATITKLPWGLVVIPH